MLQDFCQYHIFTRYQMNEMVSRNKRDINSELLQNHVKFDVINFQWPANVSSSQNVIVLVLYRIGCSLYVRYQPCAQASNCQTCQVDHDLMQLYLLYLVYPQVVNLWKSLYQPQVFPNAYAGFNTPIYPTLQQLKLQGIKIWDVLSSLDIHRLNVLRMTLVFFESQNKWLQSCVLKRRSCNRKITGSHPMGQSVTTLFSIVAGNKHLWKISFSGFKFFAILAVKNFANINSNEQFCPVGYSVGKLWQ